MADISQIKIGTIVYDIKDKTARGTQGALHFLGTTTTEITDNGTESPAVTVGSVTTTWVSGTPGTGQKALNPGDVVIYGSSEFVWDGAKWHNFGDTSTLEEVEVAAKTHKHSVSYSKTDPTHTVTQGSVSATGKFTPAGTISTGTGTANYTPAGSVSSHNHTIGSTSKKMSASATGGGLTFSTASVLTGVSAKVASNTYTLGTVTTKSISGTVPAYTLGNATTKHIHAAASGAAVTLNTANVVSSIVPATNQTIYSANVHEEILDFQAITIGTSAVATSVKTVTNPTITLTNPTTKGNGDVTMVSAQGSLSTSGTNDVTFGFGTATSENTIVTAVGSLTKGSEEKTATITPTSETVLKAVTATTQPTITLSAGTTGDVDFVQSVDGNTGSKQPTFTGTGVRLVFTGTEGDVSVSGSTSGVAVSDHTYTSTAATVGNNTTGATAVKFKSQS